MSSLSERKKRILQVIVEEYIRSGEPVGSRTISRIDSIQVSPATIRNEMSDLEESGYIRQPHTSSGRIPTELALRYYVDNLLDVTKLKEEEEEKLAELRKGTLEKKAYLKSILLDYSRMLSTIANYPGLLLLTDEQNLTYRKVQLLKIDDNHLLVTLISSVGTVTNEYVNCCAPVSQEKLNQLSLEFNERKNAFSLEDLRCKLTSDLLIKSHQLSGSSDLDENETLYIEGMKTLFEHKEFAMRPERMCRFLELMESKSAIAGALMEFIKATEGVPMVKMGRELKGLENLEISIVGVPLFEDSNSIGTLGLIGPMRMEYGRVLGLLNSFLQSFNEKNGE